MLSCFSGVQLFGISWTVALWLLGPWNFSGKNIGVGCHFLQGIFLTQESNSGIKSMSPVSPALAGQFFTTSATIKAQDVYI